MFSKNTQIQIAMKIRPVGAESFHAERQMERHDEANSRFSQSFRKFANVPKHVLECISL